MPHFRTNCPWGIVAVRPRYFDLLEVYRKTSGAPDADVVAWFGRIDNGECDKLAAGDSWNHAACECLAAAS